MRLRSNITKAASARQRWILPATLASLLAATGCGEDQQLGTGAGNQPPSGTDSDDCRRENICRQDLVCNQSTGNCEVPQPCGGRCRNGELCQKGVCVDPAPPVVTIILSGAVIRPMKLDGTPWDGFGSVSQQAKDALASALSSINPYASLIRLLDDGALSALSKPDPFGTAEVSGTGSAGAEVNLPKNQDSFRPGWDARWHGIRLDPDRDVRLRVRLTDADLTRHDSIGTASVNSSELRDVLASRSEVHVEVDGGRGQILFLDVEVIEE